MGRCGQTPKPSKWNYLLSLNHPEVEAILLVLGCIFGWNKIVETCLEHQVPVDSLISKETQALYFDTLFYKRFTANINPLGAALFYQHYHLALLLLEKGANPNLLMDKDIDLRVGDLISIQKLDEIPIEPPSSLFQQVCLTMIQKGWDIYQTDKLGRSFAFFAIEWGNLNALSFFFKQDKDRLWVSEDERVERFHSLLNKWKYVQDSFSWGPIEEIESKEFKKQHLLQIFELWFSAYPQDEAIVIQNDSSYFEQLMVELNQYRFEHHIPKAKHEHIYTRL